MQILKSFKHNSFRLKFLSSQYNYSLLPELFSPLRTNILKRLRLYNEEFEKIQSILMEKHDSNTRYAESMRMKLNEIQPMVSLYEKMNASYVAAKDLDKMLLESNDKETKEFVMDEKSNLIELLDEIEEKSIELLVPMDRYDNCHTITVEIRPGVGGTESALFAEEALNMFQNYFTTQGWNYKLTNFLVDSNLGKGCKCGIMKVSGDEVYKKMKCESGVHKYYDKFLKITFLRVIRVPETEKSGRLHSSTIAVVVLPEIPLDFRIDEKDLKYEYMRSSGPGGQHVNKTESACRVTHIPSGLAVFNQEDRSQDKNKKRALEILTNKLFTIEIEKAQDLLTSSRKDQISGGDRSDKIRTYNFPQSRITDHRTGLTKHGIEKMMNGDFLEEFIEEFSKKVYQQKLNKLLEDLEKQK